MFSLYYLFIIDILLNSMLKKMKVTKLLDLRRKKYLFKSTHRGTKEIDILLGRFVEMNINKLSDNELKQLEQIINLDEHKLFLILTKKMKPPNSINNSLVKKIILFNYNFKYK